MAEETTEKPKSKSNFGEGLVNEFLGKAKRGDVSAFNLENFLFGTLGHVATGVGITALVMHFAGKESKGLIKGLFKKAA